MRFAIETGVEVLTLTDEHEATPNRFVLLDPDGTVVHQDRIYGIETAGNYVFHWSLERDRTNEENQAVIQWLKSEEEQAVSRRVNHTHIAQAAIARWATYWTMGDEDAEELARGDFIGAIEAHAKELVADYRSAADSGDAEEMNETVQALRFLWFRSLQDWQGDAVTGLIDVIGPELSQQLQFFSPYDMAEETED